MINYLKKSFDKFNQDVLSKLFYDILKWLVPTTVVFAATKIFPKETSINEFLRKQISLTLYFVLLMGLLIIIITTIVIAFIFSKKYKKLKGNSLTDELTGLKNHKAFNEYLNQKLVVINNNKTFSVIIVDIDNFKIFNTNYSPSFADKVLGKIGELLKNDKRITDEIFRQYLRGDEFVIITNDTSLNDAVKAAERKRKLVENTTLIIDDTPCKLTVSCGVTEFKKGKDNFQMIIDRANAALVEAKSKDGKNNTVSII